MEDPEAQDTTPMTTQPTHVQLLIFGRPCKMQNDTLTLREVHRLCALVLLLSSVCSTAICYQRDAVGKTFNIRWLPVAATGVMSLMYTLQYANNYMGGWGAADGKFWCDVKIMYVRGFNTIRTVFRFINACILFTCVCQLLSVESSTAFVCLLMILCEWQAGVSENVNQYDIRFQDKFVDTDGCLSLESLHSYQASHCNDNVSWSSFTVHCAIQVSTLTFVIIGARLQTELVLAVPVIACIILWAFLWPAMLHFAYLKHTCTFTQLEIYRMVGDVAILSLTAMFSLV